MKIVILFTLLLATITMEAQISAGTLKIQNLGDRYRLSVDQQPFNYSYPKPDSVSIRISVICPKTGAFESNFLPLNGSVEYKMGGTNYIACTVFWWRDGVKRSQTSMKTYCGFFTNPLECFSKI